MHARALDYAMYNYAHLCTMHFDEDTRGLQTRGLLGLLTLCRLAAGGTPRSSFSDDGRISSSCKAPSAMETCASAFWWTKLSMINTTMNCIGQESSRTLCTIMQISQIVHYAQLCTIMHVHNFPSPAKGRGCSARHQNMESSGMPFNWFPIWPLGCRSRAARPPPKSCNRDSTAPHLQ